MAQGIPRATTAWPDIELIDDRRGNPFKAIVRRPKPHAQAIAPAGIGPTPEVTGEVWRLLAVMVGEMKRVEIQDALGLKHEDHFRDA